MAGIADFKASVVQHLKHNKVHQRNPEHKWPAEAQNSERDKLNHGDDGNSIAWSDGQASTDAYSVIMDSLLLEVDSIFSKHSYPPMRRPDAKRHHSEPDQNQYQKRDHEKEAP